MGFNPFHGIYDIGDGGRIDRIVSSRGGSALWSTLDSPLIGYTGKFMRATFALPVLFAVVPVLPTLFVCFNYFLKLVMSLSSKILNIKIHCTFQTEGRNQHTYSFRPSKLSSEATLLGRTEAATGSCYGGETDEVFSCRHCQRLCRCSSPRRWKLFSRLWRKASLCKLVMSYILLVFSKMSTLNEDERCIQRGTA